MYSNKKDKLILAQRTKYFHLLNKIFNKEEDTNIVNKKQCKEKTTNKQLGSQVKTTKKKKENETIKLLETRVNDLIEQLNKLQELPPKSNVSQIELKQQNNIKEDKLVKNLPDEEEEEEKEKEEKEEEEEEDEDKRKKEEEEEDEHKRKSFLNCNENEKNIEKLAGSLHDVQLIDNNEDQKLCNEIYNITTLIL